MKLQGGILMYALAISLIIGMITASALLCAHYNRMLLQRDVVREEVARNAHSGIQYLCIQGFVDSNEEDIDLFGRGKDSVYLQSKPWGVYDILISTAHTGKEIFQRAALSGSLTDSADRYALWLGDMDRPLKITGRTELKGRCFLPRSGAERTYIEGKSYAGRELVYGPVHNSSRFIPSFNKERVSYLEELLSGSIGEGDSLVSWNELTAVDSVIHSFTGSAMVVQEKTPLVLSGIYINGQVRIHSTVSIEVKSTAMLVDVLLVAPEIRIESNTIGQFQVIARDSIRLGKKAIMKFPSAFSLCSGKESPLQTGVVLEEECEFNGDIFAVKEENNLGRKLLVDVSKDVTIVGNIYCNNVVDLKGKVFGSVTTQKFVLTTNSAVYENTLMDAVIDQHHSAESETPAARPDGCAFGTFTRKQVIHWVY